MPSHGLGLMATQGRVLGGGASEPTAGTLALSIEAADYVIDPVQGISDYLLDSAQGIRFNAGSDAGVTYGEALLAGAYPGVRAVNTGFVASSAGGTPSGNDALGRALLQNVGWAMFLLVADFASVGNATLFDVSKGAGNNRFTVLKVGSTEQIRTWATRLDAQSVTAGNADGINVVTPSIVVIGAIADYANGVIRQAVNTTTFTQTGILPSSGLTSDTASGSNVAIFRNTAGLQTMVEGTLGSARLWTGSASPGAAKESELMEFFLNRYGVA